MKSTIDWDPTTKSSPTPPAGHHPGPNTDTDPRGSPQVAQWESICLQCERCRTCRFKPWVGKIPWPAVQEEHRAPSGVRPPICIPIPQRKIPEFREVREHPRDTQHTRLTHTLPPLPDPAGLGIGPQPFACPGRGRGKGHKAEMLGRGGNSSPL